MNYRPSDRRSERSRRAILDAFGVLFFENGYDGVDVREVAIRANIGRSTFYRHFRSKEALLLESLTPFLAGVAAACVDEEEPIRLSFVFEHFWQNRRLAPAVFSGRAMTLVSRRLASTIEQRLASVLPAHRQTFPISLVAAQLASGQMMMLSDWLRGRGSCSPAQFACGVHRSSRAVVRAMLLEPREE